MVNEKKFLDYEGVKHLWSKVNMQDYPNNDTLVAILDAIDETKANKDELFSKSWNDLTDKPFGEDAGSILAWDGNIDNKESFEVYRGSMVKTFDKVFYLGEIEYDGFKVYIQLNTGELLTLEGNNGMPADYGPLKGIELGLGGHDDTHAINIGYSEGDKRYFYSIVDWFSDKSVYAPGTYFYTGKFKDSDGNEYEGYVCGVEINGFKFFKTIAENEELLGRVGVANGGVPKTDNQPNDAVLCNVDGTPAWKELKNLITVNDGQGLIEFYDPKDALCAYDITDTVWTGKDYKVFEGELTIEDYANGGSIIYEDTTGLKIVEFISINRSVDSSINLGGRMGLFYELDNPDNGFYVIAMNYNTGYVVNGVHYYPKDIDDRSAGLYFSWNTDKNNNPINVKGLYLNGCKKFIKPQICNVEYTDSFTFNGDLRNKPEMKTHPDGWSSGGRYWISNAIFTIDDFKNGCPCRFVDSSGVQSNTKWGIDSTCQVYENQKYVDIVYTDDNGNTINIGYYCFEGSSYPPGFYMYNADDFKILGLSVPGVKKFAKEIKTNEELAHKGKTYSNSISWDYDMENRETDGNGFYKISDEHFTLEDLKDGYFVEYCPNSVSEDNYGFTYYVDETQCWAEMLGGYTSIWTTDENGNTYATILSVPEGFLQSPGTYFYCDDWYFNAPYSLSIRGFKKFIGNISSEEAVSPIAKKEKTNVLTWDGIVTEPSNLHIIGWKEDESNRYWNYSFFYKVSNAIITPEDLKDGVLTRVYSYEYSEWTHIPFDENNITIFEDGSIKINCYDSYGNHMDGYDIICYPENSTYPAGVYFGCSRDVFYSAYKLDECYVSDFEIPNVYKFNAVNKIDGKYLSNYNDIPNIPVGILPTGGDTLIWDGNTEGLESIKDNTFFKVSSAFDIDDLANAESIIIEYNSSPSGETIIEEACWEVADDSGRLFKILGFDEDENEHILAYINYEGIYFADTATNGYMYIHSLTVPGFKKFPLLKKLDKKYLPEDIGVPEVTTADNGKFLRVIDGVWAAATIPNAEGATFGV